MAKNKRASENKVESIRHKDKRKNIPTEELRDFVADDEAAPKTMLYPRDPSLDPQLVWKGKDEQDRQDLAVPVVPIYIQEKIHPQAIIDDLLAQAKKAKPENQLKLFADFNGIEDFDNKVDFYHHEQHWTNRMILGDSLLVMTSLAEKEGLKGKVQTIYIDPPYGIKFGSNWQVSTRKRDVKDGKLEDATRQPEQIRAFRDTWKLGIHSYLAYLRDRFVAARELLTETGSVFVQIGDENGFFRFKVRGLGFLTFVVASPFVSMYQETSLITEGPWLGSPSMSTFHPRWKSPVTSGIRTAMAWRCGGPCPYDAAVKNVAATTSPTSSSKQSPRRSGTSTCGSSRVSGFTKLPSIAVRGVTTGSTLSPRSNARTYPTLIASSSSCSAR